MRLSQLSKELKFITFVYLVHFCFQLIVSVLSKPVNVTVIEMSMFSEVISYSEIKVKIFVNLGPVVRSQISVNPGLSL